MTGDFLLGVDIGTQGVKSALFDREGRCVSSAFIPSRLIQPEPGITEEDPDFQVDSVCRAIRNCVASSNAEPGQIRALAIDGQMAGVIGVGEDGRAVTPYDSWLDTRCAPQIREMKEEAEEEIILKTGNPPSFNHGPKILWWKSRQPETFRKIARFVQPGGYAVMRLCGLAAREAFIDRSYLHFSGFADNPRAVWDADLLGKFDVPPEKMPRIVESTEIMGGLTPAMAQACGLPAGLPVAAGCGDTAASFLSCGAVRPGICVDVAGTASVFAATTGEFCADTRTQVLGCGASVTPGLWHPYAYINGGGLNLEWFVRELLDRSSGDPGRFDGLTTDLSYISDTNPLFLPHLAGRVSPSQPDQRGTFAGLEWNHGRKEMFMSVLESVALEYGIYRRSLDRMLPGRALSELRITGGGENNRLWMLMKSGVLRIPVTGVRQKQGAPLGSAIVAGCAAGLFDDPASAADAWIALDEPVTCPSEAWDYYSRRVERYDRLLAAAMNRFYSGESVGR